MITMLGFASVLPAFTFVAWTLAKALLDIEAHRADEDIRRIEEGLPKPAPAPVESEPFRRIAWEVDETIERILREATDELFWIKAVEPVCA